MHNGAGQLAPTTIAVTVIIVLLYASFLLIEQRSFDARIAAISSDPRSIARIRRP